MTITEIQCYLAGLGYYTLRRQDGTLAIDGITGPATSAAVLNFQMQHRERPDGSQLIQDGQAGPATQKAIREVIGTQEKPQKPEPAPEPTPDPDHGYKWINPEDWRCRCGGRYCKGWPAQPSKKTMDLLEKFGQHFGRRPVVHSGLRCQTWNRLQGGGGNSKHMYGMAVDFHIPGVSPETLRDYAEQLMPGWGGIGIYSWGIHIDDRPTRGRWDSRGR